MEPVVSKLSLAHTLSVYLVEPSSVQARFITDKLKLMGVDRVKVFDSALAVLEAM